MTYQALIPKVTTGFGLKCIEVGSAQKGYRNESYRLVLASGDTINLIFHKYEREVYERMKSADLASELLFAAGLPVRTRFDTRTLKLSDGKKEIFAGIYTYLPGNTIPWEAYTKNHIKLLGWAMSDMHAAWQGSGGRVSPRIDNELTLLLGRMERYFKSQDVKRALQNKLELTLHIDYEKDKRLMKRIGKVAESDERFLHMDFVRGNVLFGVGDKASWKINDVALTGIIDFEKAAIGHPVFDIARTLAFLLIDCASKDRRSIYKYFLESGYNKRGKSTFSRNEAIAGMPAEKVLNLLIGFFLFHDFYKFLKHTPYESLESNHHFVRTRDILIDYGMLRLSKD